jgi:excisionase family DNA binding protein
MTPAMAQAVKRPKRPTRPTKPRPPRYATVAEAADYVRLCEKTLLRHIAAGNLKANRVGGRWIVEYTDLDSFVAAGSLAASA